MTSISDILTTAGLSVGSAWPKAGAAGARGKTGTGTASPTSTAASSLFKADDERSKQAKHALEVMKQVREAERAGQKSTAKMRLEMLRRQIDMLRMFGGTTKGVARELARLARELTSAVKQYSGADASTIDTGTPATAGGTADGREAAKEGGEGEAKDGKSAQVVFAGADKLTADKLTDGKAPGDAKDPKATEPAQLAKDAEAAQLAKDAEAAQLAKAAEAAKAEKEAADAKAKADQAAKEADAADSREFFGNARDLLKKIKQLLEEARKQHPDKIEVFHDAVKAVQESNDTIIDLAPQMVVGVTLKV